LVDKDAEAEVLSAKKSLDHRKTDKGGIGKSASQHQPTGRRRRKAEYTAHKPEKGAAEAEHDPWHQCGKDQAGVEVKIVDVGKR
jgi:hypothetical protein